jgi:ribosomal protein S18 acetylase RimI-like enzyme
MSVQQQFLIRDQLKSTDSAAVREILVSSGFFYEEEVAVAEELVQERQAKGPASGYHFLLADSAGGSGKPRTVGFTCFGPIALTHGSHDLFWIAVHEQARHSGLGSRLLAESERRIAGMGGRRVYVETSSRPLYEPTRSFYLKRGYRTEATLEDFYAPGDGKVIFVKVLETRL